MRATWPTVLLAVLLGWGGAARTAPAAEAGRPAVKRQLILVGYDVAQNEKARQMLEKMCAAAQRVGAESKVLYADNNAAALDAALSDALATAIRPVVEKPELHLLSPTAAPGGKIIVQHSDMSITNSAAWIGFYRQDAPHDRYVAYTFLLNLNSRLYDVEAPDEPGLYNFRLFPNEGYDPVAVSDPVEVK